ncbi:DUF6984 family protein [Xylophilus sp. GOD-11R]|uniref:DUF6984 family protein n=1 Tax=Xylophilus sp. GOD-11R TaxID=3089814 RepID=UPI00298CE534|nr:hypothetical protein [Xylophilus sp. GOD-11R]WPB59203.1 hypothetical protein R9X41_11375 [Xylophilus sp. GOD-11R]
MDAPNIDQKILLNAFRHECKAPEILGYLSRNDLLTEKLDDGDMGSFEIHFKNLPKNVFFETKKVAPTLVANDSDNVPIFATLFLRNGIPSSIELWKVDFSPVLTFPREWKAETVF